MRHKQKQKQKHQYHHKQQWLVIRATKQFIAETFIKTTPHWIFLAVIFLLRGISLIYILLWTGSSDNNLNTVTLQQGLIVFVLWVCLIYTSLIIISILYMLIKIYINTNKKSSFSITNSHSQHQHQHYSYLFNMIEKLTIYSLVVYRVFVIIPLMFVALQGLLRQSLIVEVQQQSKMVSGLAVTNLVLALCIVYPLSGVGFWNKIGIKQDGLAYCTVVNVQLIIYVSMPILIVLRVYSWQVQSYIGIVFSILSILTIYTYPLVTFNHNKLHTISSVSVVSIVCVLGFGIIIEGRVDSFGRFLVVVLVIGVMVLAMWQVQVCRMRRLLVKGYQNKDDNVNNSSNKNNNKVSFQIGNSNNNKNINNLNKINTNIINRDQPNNNNKISINNNNISINNNKISINNNNISINNNTATPPQLSWLTSQSYYQNILYHLLNWKDCQQQLMLYVLSTLKYNNQPITIGDNITNINSGNKQKLQGILRNDSMQIGTRNQQNSAHSKGKSSLEYIINNLQHQHQQQYNNNNQPPSTPTTTQILRTLTHPFISQPHLYHQFCQLITQQLTHKCNLQHILSQKLGHSQLLKVLQQSLPYFILLLQSLMQQTNNFTKTYLLIKLQQHLLYNQAKSSSFIQSIYSITIIQIIQSHLTLQFKTHSNQYSPPYNYFLFQQHYQKLKTHIKQSMQNKLLFWKETNKQQPLQHKLKQYVTKNYMLEMKILKHTKRITNNYQTSPLLLISLIQSYTQLALNTNMTSSKKNTFNFLAVQFHKLYNDNRNRLFSKGSSNSQLKQQQTKLMNSLLIKSSGDNNSNSNSNSNNANKIKNKNSNNKLQNIYNQLQTNPPSHLQKHIQSLQQHQQPQHQLHQLHQQQQINQQQNITKYSVQKNIGVFLLNLESPMYDIEWANQYFYQNYIHQRNNGQGSSQQISNVKDNNNNKSKYCNKDITINDLIIPQLRQAHNKYMHNFVYNGSSQLSYKHIQTELYYPQDQTFINVNMEFQFLPTLSQGLKIIGFVHPVKTTHKDVVQIILKSDLTFVASTKSFMDHYQQYSLFKDHINFEKDKSLAFDIIMQNNIFGEFFTNLRIKQSRHSINRLRQSQKDDITINNNIINKNKNKEQQQEISTKISHLGMDYKVKLKKKISYEGKIRQGMKQTQQQTNLHLLVFGLQTTQTISKSMVIDAKQPTNTQMGTPMKKSKMQQKGSTQTLTDSFFIQQDKLDQQSPLSSRIMQSMKGSQQIFFKGTLSSQSSGRNSPKNQQNNNEKNDIIMQDILIKERQKIEDKPVEIVNLQKCYQILVSQKTPNNVKRWRWFTAIVLFALMSAMVCNMVFLTQREQLYSQNNDLAINFSSLIADLSATVTAIREYNFYVAIHSVDSPQITFIVSKLIKLSDIISKKVKQLASVLKKSWIAYQLLPTGATINVRDTSYVVISNYMLSSVTFVSQLPATYMSFPIRVGEIYQGSLSPTPAQISFLEAVFNGLYVAIPNLLIDRREFIDTMTDNLLSTSSMYFIYTCIGGSLCLLIFFTWSLNLQLNSQGIRSQTGGLLSSKVMTNQEKFRKIQKLQRLGEILYNSKGQCLITPDWEDEQQKYKYMNVLAQTLKEMDFGQFNNNNNNINQQQNKSQHEHQHQHQHPHQQGKSDIALNTNNNPRTTIKQQNIVDDKTNRQFMDNQQSMRSSRVSGSSVDDNHASQEHTQKGMKIMDGFQVIQRPHEVRARSKPIVNKIESGGQFQLYKVTIKQRSLLIIFYLIVCVPFLSYFIGILIGSMQMNATIVKHITITSQVFNRKSYQQIVYLLTRETAYFEPFLMDKIANWNQYLMEIIDDTYDRDRKVQKLVMQQKTAVNLQKKLSQLNHNDLCQHLSQFPISTYHNITFTPQQCLDLGDGIMSQGYKQLIVTLLQSSLQLNKNYPNPAYLTNTQRVQYLQNYELKKMKAILAYSEQFIQQMVTASLIDMQVQIQSLRQLSILLSMISIFSLILFLIVIRYRYQKLLVQRRQVQSVINLISIETISNSLDLNHKQQHQQKTENSQLIKMVQRIDWKFYQ